MLVSYLYETKRVGGDYVKSPFGCVVATSPHNVGVSICSSADSFNKKKARDIAFGRAAENKRPEVKGRVRTIDGIVSKEEMIRDKVEFMRERARRYFF
jgi:hypothetical protein